MSEIDTEQDQKLEDRGDEITTEQTEAAKAAEAKRDEKGRFVKTDTKADEKADVAKEAEEGEEAEETEETEEDADGKTDPLAAKQVPYTRFKEVVEQRKQLQSELAQLRSSSKTVDKQENEFEAQQKAFDKRLDELYEQVESARADGDTKTAAKLQREIDGMNGAKAKAEAAFIARQAAFTEQQNSTYNQMLDYLEKVRPVIDPNAPEFSKEVVSELEFQVDAYTKAGLTPTAALRRACALLFEEDPFTATVQREDKKTPTAVVAAKKKVDVAKNVDAAKKTPPSSSSRNESGDSTAINPVNLSDEEFDKLPESKKRQLRGDDL